jgi:hypothetical protein
MSLTLKPATDQKRDATRHRLAGTVGAARSDNVEGGHVGAALPDRPTLPDRATRWRCGGCGNLTRFDVARTRRTTEFWHVDLAGEVNIEETRTDHEDVESVTCRWCGRSDVIEIVPRTTSGVTSS